MAITHVYSSESASKIERRNIAVNRVIDAMKIGIPATICIVFAIRGGLPKIVRFVGK